MPSAHETIRHAHQTSRRPVVPTVAGRAVSFVCARRPIRAGSVVIRSSLRSSPSGNTSSGNRVTFRFSPRFAAGDSVCNLRCVAPRGRVPRAAKSLLARFRGLAAIQRSARTTRISLIAHLSYEVHGAVKRPHTCRIKVKHATSIHCCACTYRRDLNLSCPGGDQFAQKRP